MRRLSRVVQALRQTPAIAVRLNDPCDSYTTLDTISGYAEVTTTVDTFIDDVQILFVGIARTFVERPSAAASSIASRYEAFHQFIKLTQPHLAEHFPEHSILKANHIYRFPFVFVVPQELPPNACRHAVDSDVLRQDHLQLPPSFGDHDDKRSSKRRDEMVPDMTRICYRIVVHITSPESREEPLKSSRIATKSYPVHVSPTRLESPPLVITNHPDYVMRQESILKKNLVTGKLGMLIAEVEQPASLRIHRNSEDNPTPAVANICLRFEPYDITEAPPRLGRLTCKLKAHTYYGSSGQRSHPTRNAAMIEMNRGVHSEQVDLAARCMANAAWTRHEVESASTPLSSDEMLARRDSVQSVSPSTTGETRQRRIYWTTTLNVPLILPKNKVFVPTFHSCLISRTYMLKLELRVRASGPGSRIDLKVPLQMTFDGSAISSPQSPLFPSAEDVEDEEDRVRRASAVTVEEDFGGFLNQRRRSTLAIVSNVDEDVLPAYST